MDSKEFGSILGYIDRNGRIIKKDSNPFSSVLEMDHTVDGVHLWMHVQASPYGNGSCHVKINEDGKCVFEATSNYTARPYNISVKKSKEGKWKTLLSIKT